MGVAIRFSFFAHFHRSTNGQEATASHSGRNLASCIEKSRRCRGYCEARELPQPPAFIRNAFVDARLRHSHGAGVAWTQGREHDDDLHARVESTGRWREKPAGLRTKETLTLGSKRRMQDARQPIRLPLQQDCFGAAAETTTCEAPTLAPRRGRRGAAV